MRRFQGPEFFFALLGAKIMVFVYYGLVFRDIRAAHRVFFHLLDFVLGMFFLAAFKEIEPASFQQKFEKEIADYNKK